MLIDCSLIFFGFLVSRPGRFAMTHRWRTDDFGAPWISLGRDICRKQAAICFQLDPWVLSCVINLFQAKIQRVFDREPVESTDRIEKRWKHPCFFSFSITNKDFWILIVGDGRMLYILGRGHEKPRGNTLFPSILHEEKYRMIFFWRKTSAKVSRSRLNTFWIDFQMHQTTTNQLETQGSSGYTTLAYPDQTVGRRNSSGWTHRPFLLRRTEGGAFSAHWSQTRELRPDFKNPLTKGPKV